MKKGFTMLIKKIYKKKNNRPALTIHMQIWVLFSATHYLLFKNLSQSATILITGILVQLIYSWFQAHQKKINILNSGIKEIDKMTGDQFEELLLQHFKGLGYSGYVTRGSADYGADLVVKKDDIVIVIQAKRWNQKVGIDAIQQVAGAVKHYDAQQAIAITNNYFTKNAIELAKSNNVTLWDRNKLISLLLNKNILKDGEPTLLCPDCGNKLVERNGKNGLFYGCSGYPVCRYTRNI